MYGVSSQFLTAIHQSGRTLKSKATVTKIGYADLNLDDTQIMSIYHSSTAISGEDFEIGTTCAAELDMEFTNIDGSLSTATFQDASITASIGVLLADGLTYEYCPLGVFYVDSISRTETSIKVKCYDAMIKLETLYLSSLTYPKTLLQIAQDIAAKAGLTLSVTTFPNASFSVAKKPDLAGVTLRSAISWVAEAAGCFARIDRSGNLDINFYAGTTESINAQNYFTLTHDEQSRAAIAQVAIKQNDTDIGVSSGSAGNTYTITGNPLLVTNPSTALKAIYNQLKDFTYMPFQADWQGNPALMAGDIITIVDRSNNSYNTILTESDLTYEGGLKVTSSAKSKTTQAQTFQTSTAVADSVKQVASNQQTINNLLAGNITADNITAGTITADKIKAGTITAASAVIANAAIGTAQIADASIVNAKIGTAAIERANIKDAAIGTAQIDTASITTAQIQNAAITTALIGTGAVDTAQIADGSITDAKIVALTANKITAGTIDASKITVTNLNCANLTVGTINGQQIASGAVTATQLASTVNTSITTAQTTASAAQAAIANLQIGGRNLWIKTAATNNYITSAGGLYSADMQNMTSDYIAIDPTRPYEYSYWGTITSGNFLWTGWAFYDANKAFVGSRQVKTESTVSADTYLHYSYAVTVPTEIQATAKYVRIGSRLLQNGGSAKFEIGNVATDWSPAPEDTLAQIAAVQTSANGKNTIYRQAAQPSGGTYTAGDVWFDTGNGNRAYVYSGSVWTLSQFGYQAIASIDAGTITTGSLSAARIAAGTIVGTQIASATIAAGNIVSGTITAAQIASGTITSTQIAAATITGDRLVANTITASQIASATITATQIAANTITAAKIAAGTITAVQIAAGTITADKINTTNLSAATISVNGYTSLLTVGGVTMPNGLPNDGLAVNYSGNTEFAFLPHTPTNLSVDYFYCRQSCSCTIGGSFKIFPGYTGSGSDPLGSFFNSDGSVVLAGYTLSGLPGHRCSVIPTVGSDGVMEIGGYLDFHESAGDTSDYSSRLFSNGGTLTTMGNFNCKGQLTISGSTYPQIIGDGTTLQLANSSAVSAGVVIQDGSFKPATDNQLNLGASTKRWATVYAITSTINTSDRNEKNSITPLDTDKATRFISALNPVSYKYNSGTSDRTHYGMIAQDVEDEMTALGMTSADFAGFIKSPKTDEDGNDVSAESGYIYGLRYEEFISPLIKTVQNLLKRCDALEKKVKAR